MNFISVRELKGKSVEMWKKLDEQGNLILTNHGKPVAVLSRVQEEGLEEMLEAWDQAKTRVALAKMRNQAKSKGLDRWGLDEINALIARTRKERRR